MLADRVANRFPTKTAARRIAIIGEAVGQQERAWHTCNKCQWQFATEWRDMSGFHTTDRCNQCFSTDITSTPMPFVGPSGFLLNKLLAQVGIDRDACFVGNCCQVQPPANDITRFKWDGSEMQEGLQQLRADLAAYQPHFCLLLGNTPLRAFLGTIKVNIMDRQGYFFMSNFTGRPVKCLPVLHPAALLREANLTGHTRLYLQRAAEETHTDGLEVPVRNIAINLSKQELLGQLTALRRDHTYVDIDIEGGCGMGPACIGFATSPHDAFVVPFYGVDGESIWCESDECELVAAVAAVLEDPNVPKCIMNALYEQFVIAWTWGVLVRGVVDDLMLLHFESHAELDKALEFQASIYTKQPYWKLTHKSVGGRYVPFHWDGRRATTAEWFAYNGTDCCVTAECRQVAAKQLMPKQREHYEQNVELLAPILYMELRGIRFDVEAAQARLATTTKRIYALQHAINKEAASSRPALAEFYEALRKPGLQRLLPILQTAFCRASPAEQREVTEHYFEPQRWNGKKWCKAGKRIPAEAHDAIEAACKAGAWQGSQPPTLQASDKGQTWLKPASKAVTKRCSVAIETFEDVQRFAKDSCAAECKRAIKLIGQAQRSRSGWTPAQRGELATLLGLSVKINATNVGGDAQWFLYTHCLLPKQFQKDGNKLTDRLASDDEAVIKAWVKTKDRRAIWFLNLRRMVTATKSLRAQPDADGRIRGEANLVGTETHRIANYGSPTGSSDLNLSTITKSHRDLYLADEGCWMVQRDLAGADGWTVAAYAAMLGDRTMLDDYLAGLKPAQIICLMLDRGVGVNKLSRDELRPLCKPITESKDWRYFPMKRGQHGWCFTAGHELLTPAGWKPIEQVQVSDQVAAYNNQTRAIHFEQPSQMHSFLYSGNLYTFRGHTIDMTVTAEHRMPYVTNGNPKVITAAELFRRKAAHLPTAGHYFTLSGCYDSAFGQLLAAIQSDGCYTKRGYLVFNFRKQRKIERIEMLLKLNGMRFTSCKCKDNTTKFSITDKRFLENWKQYGKHASAKMLSFSHDAIVGYLKEYPLWDGWVKGDKRVVFSVHKEHLEWIDTFLHLSGANGCYAGSSTSGFGSTVHRLSINDRTFADLGSLSEKSYEEVEKVPVYCLAVSTGFIMVRRSGKIFASGNTYLMGDKTTSDQILTDTFKKDGKPVYMEPRKLAAIRDGCFFVRYPGIPLLHQWMARELYDKGELRASDGFVRRFYGRKGHKTPDGRLVPEPSTQREAMAHLPQYYTTRATVTALLRMWSDSENRREDGSLISEPLHTQHDSLIYQFPKEVLEWGKRKSVEWFDNPFLIAQTVLTIPASGSYGPSWGEQPLAL